METGGLVRRRPHHVCVGLPSVEGVTRDDPEFFIVDVPGLWAMDDDRARPARVHFYQIGPEEYRVVGLERPYDLDAPSARD